MGKLLFASASVRADIAYPVPLLSRQLADPTRSGVSSVSYRSTSTNNITFSTRTTFMG